MISSADINPFHTTVDALTRKRGRFMLRRELLKTNARQLLKLFAHMVVVEATSRWEIDGVEYVALSPHFAELADGEMAPIYKINFRQTGDGVELASVERAPNQ